MHTPKKLGRSIRETDLPDKKDEFKQERSPRRDVKIPIWVTFNELSDMDFVVFGNQADPPHLRDTFPMFPRAVRILAESRMRKPRAQ